MAEDYADLAILKTTLNLKADDTTSDALLQQAITAASRGIDRICGRRFWLDPTPVQRVYAPSGRFVRDCDGERLLVNDIGDTAGMVVESVRGGMAAPVDGFETSPDNALADDRPVTALTLPSGSWGYGTSRVRVTARWGWPSVPAEVVQATQIQASRLYKRKDSPEGVIGSAEWGVVRLARVDPDVAALIQHLMLPGFG